MQRVAQQVTDNACGEALAVISGGPMVQVTRVPTMS